jgi:hypothetical protein
MAPLILDLGTRLSGELHVLAALYPKKIPCLDTGYLMPVQLIKENIYPLSFLFI